MNISKIELSSVFFKLSQIMFIKDDRHDMLDADNNTPVSSRTNSAFFH